MADKDVALWWRFLVAERTRIAEDVGHPNAKPARQTGWSPRVDVLEAPDHLLVRLELAGVPPEGLTLQYNPKRHSLVVRGARQDETCPSEEPWAPHQLEIDFGEFSREVRLPEIDLALEDVRVRSVNGVALIVIPKVTQSARAEVRKTIVTGTV